MRKRGFIYSNGVGLGALFLVAAMAVTAIGLSGANAGAATHPVNGTTISDAVERELAKDQAVPAHQILVLTTDGVVSQALLLGVGLTLGGGVYLAVAWRLDLAPVRQLGRRLRRRVLASRVPY